MRISSGWVLAVALASAGGGWAWQRRLPAPDSLPPAAQEAARLEALVAPDLSDRMPAALAARAVASRILRADQAELGILFREEMALQPRDELKLRFILKCWVLVDPDRCLAAMIAAQGPEAWEAVITTWMERDAKAAAGWMAVHGGEVPPALRMHLAEKLAQLTGDRRLLSIPFTDEGDTGNLAGILLENLWKSSPPEVLRQLGTPDEPGALYDQAWRLMPLWAAGDPDAVMAWIGEVKNANQRARFMQAAIAGFQPADLRRAADWILNEKSGDVTKRDVLVHLMARWGATDPAEALAWCRARPVESDQGAAARVFTVASAKGLGKALGSLEAAGFDANECARICRQWSITEDPAQLRRYWAELKDLPEGKARGILTKQVAQSLADLARADPLLQAELEALPVSPEAAEKFHTALVMNKIRDDPSAVLQHLRNPALAVTPDLIYQTARMQPEAVADALLTRTDATPAQFAQLMSGWEEVDPAGAGRWVSSLPDTPNAQRAANKVSYFWCSEDPAAASAWVAGLGASPLRDSAAAGLVETLVTLPDYEPESLAWAASITDEKIRQRAVTSALNGWMALDPAAAAAGVKASTLSAQEKNLYLGRAGFTP